MSEYNPNKKRKYILKKKEYGYNKDMEWVYTITSVNLLSEFTSLDGEDFPTITQDNIETMHQDDYWKRVEKFLELHVEKEPRRIELLEDLSQTPIE